MNKFEIAIINENRKEMRVHRERRYRIGQRDQLKRDGVQYELEVIGNKS